MGKPINDEPAFPVLGALQDHQYCGMSLRDYFAAKAMQALMEKALQEASGLVTLCAASYEVADAMLAARENTDG